MDNEFYIQMIAYIRAEFVRNPAIELNADTPLVSAGLVDSFALVDILVRLEEVTGRKLSINAISAEDLNSVRLMIDTAERLGRPFDNLR